MHVSKFYHSIRFQIIVSVIIVSSTVMSISFYVFHRYHRRQMVNSFRNYAIHLNDAMEDALELAMQGHNINEMQHVIQRMGERYDIERAFILTTDGKITISSSKDDIGKSIQYDEPTCQLCHQHEPEERNKTVMYSPPEGDLIMRSVNPIANQPQCYECHPKAKRINGMLVVDYSMQPIMSQISTNIRDIMFIFSVAAVVLISLFYLLMNKVVFNKLTRIVEIAKLVGKGDITQRIQAMGKNEISLLATSLNEVIQNLEESTKENEKAKDYLGRLINSTEDGILVVDRQYRVVMANNAAVADQKISVEEAIGLPCYQIACHHIAPDDNECPDDYCPAAETFETGKLVKLLRSRRDENGEPRYIEVYSSPILDESGKVMQVVKVMRDITERKRLEAQLIYSEKLSLVGRIAAGIAHEINNPIAAIAVCAEGLQKRSKDLELRTEKSLEDLPQYLETIKNNAYRCKAITQKMLTFSRQAETIFEWVNPNDVIKDVLALVEYEAKLAQKNINANLAEDIPRIRADKSQLSQVFLNLTHNGLDAIGVSGAVTITTREATDEKRGKACDFIEIIFEDTGCGIAKENRQKIFEPFFTTKPVGEGTGLGLSISESIIRKHGGDITVSSKVGVGTTFCIVLPINSLDE